MHFKGIIQKGQEVFHQRKKGTPAAVRTMSLPTVNDIFRYRYQHGTNLGSIFVLERWLSGSMYIDGVPGDSELNAIKAYAKHPPVPSFEDR